MWEGGGSPWVVRDGGWQEGGKVIFHNEMLPRGRDGKKQGGGGDKGKQKAREGGLFSTHR